MYFSKAYQSINVYGGEGRPIINHSEGKEQLKQYFKEQQMTDSLRPQLCIDQQPIYCEEVDHNIQEVGIMAVKEVRYVTELQWQRMIEEKADEKQILKFLQGKYRTQKKQLLAIQKPRNSKGQFISNKKVLDKTKSIRKHPRK